MRRKHTRSPTAKTILNVLSHTGELLPRPFESTFAYANRLKRITWPQFSQSVWHLKRRGLVTITKKNNNRFIQISKNGELETLLEKAKIQSTDKWDNKWRVLIYDIPEKSRDKRASLRFLLRKNNFYRLQASVFIHPYPFNQEALRYLQQSGLINYIRILRVDKIDNDTWLRKKFRL